MDKANKIDKVVLGVIVALIIVGYTIHHRNPIYLAPGSMYYSQAFTLLDSQKPPKEEFSLTTDIQYPENSIYKPTDDFELITKGLKQPTILSTYKSEYKAKEKTQRAYEEIGDLEKVWEYDASDIYLSFETSLVELPVSIDDKIWGLPRYNNTRIFIDPDTGKEIEQLNENDFFKYDPDLLILENGNILKFERFYSGKNHKSIGLYDKENRVIWSYRFKYFFSDPIETHYPRYITSHKDSAFIFHKGNLYCVDLSSGIMKWILKSINMLDILYFEKVNNYLFLQLTKDYKDADHKFEESKFYRLDLENLELKELVFERELFYRKLFFRGGKIYSYQRFSPGLEMKSFDFKSGVFIDSFSRPEGKEWGNSYNDNPFLLEHYSDNQVDYSIFDPTTKKETMINIHQYNFEKDFDCYIQTNYEVYHVLGNMYVEDENRFWGYDMDTHKKTWFIEKNGFSENTKVLLIDSNGVLVYDNKKLICFKKSEN